MISNLPRKWKPGDTENRGREAYFRSEGLPQSQRGPSITIILGFAFLLLLGLASINGNSALFDSAPFGGWSFLVLYQAFHFTYLATLSGRDVMPSDTGRRLGWGIFAYLTITIGALPVSIYLTGEKKFGWIAMLLSMLGLLLACRLVQSGGEFTLTLPSFAYRRERWIRAAWILVFGLAVLGARSFNLLNSDFETAGARLLAFNLARLLLVIYLGFGLFQIGTWILKLAGSSSSQLLELKGLDRVILCTVLGGAAGTIGMFMLGVANLYYTWLIFILVLPIVWISGQWLVPSTTWILFKSQHFFRHKTFYQAYLPSLLLAALIVGICLTLVVKGVWPGDAGGDVYSHYLPYYREVIAKHGVSPNALWYHYYVSKGAGLFFLGMLLSDDLAPQLVTLCFHFIFAAIVYDMVTRMTRVRIAGLFAVVLLLYLYVPLRIWGIFLKHHELMGCWLFFGVWLSIFIGRQKALRWRPCLIGGVIFAAAFALQFPTAVGLIAPLWGLIGLWYFATARSPAGLFTWVLSAASVGSVACLVAFNQWQTGLGLDTPIRLFWGFADVKHFAQWVSPYLMTYLNEGSSKGVGEIISPFARLTNFSQFEKLMRWGDLGCVVPSIRYFGIQNVGILVLVLIAAKAISKKPEIGKSEVAPLTILLKRQVFVESALFLICLTSLTWFMGNLVDQPVSIYRMFAFLSAVSITGAVVFWAMSLGVLRQGFLPSARSRRGFTAVFLTFAVCFSCSTILAGVRQRIRPMIGFALGLESAKVALASVPEEYSTHGDVWPPYLAARKLVGLRAPMLTFGIDGDLLGTSFAFPGAGLQSEVSYSLGPNWHTIAFGSPDMAEHELRSLGINYFLVDWRYESLFGGVPFSSLFAPEQLAKRFSLLADYGGVWLLTWRDRGGRGIAADQIIIWDLVRNGCGDPAAFPQTIKDFANRLGRVLPHESFAPPPLGSTDPSFIAMSSRMEAELREVLPHQLLDTTFEAVTANTREAFLQALWRLHSLDEHAELVEPSDASPSDRMTFLSQAVLRQVSRNIKRQILFRLYLEKDQDPAGIFAALNNQALANRRAKDLYDVVRETFDYNHGETNSVVRKPGLRRVEGWQ